MLSGKTADDEVCKLWAVETNWTKLTITDFPVHTLATIGTPPANHQCFGSHPCTLSRPLCHLWSSKHSGQVQLPLRAAHCNDAEAGPALVRQCKPPSRHKQINYPGYLTCCKTSQWNIHLSFFFFFTSYLSMSKAVSHIWADGNQTCCEPESYIREGACRRCHIDHSDHVDTAKRSSVNRRGFSALLLRRHRAGPPPRSEEEEEEERKSTFNSSSHRGVFLFFFFKCYYIYKHLHRNEAETLTWCPGRSSGHGGLMRGLRTAPQAGQLGSSAWVLHGIKPLLVYRTVERERWGGERESERERERERERREEEEEEKKELHISMRRGGKKKRKRRHTPPACVWWS